MNSRKRNSSDDLSGLNESNKRTAMTGGHSGNQTGAAPAAASNGVEGATRQELAACPKCGRDVPSANLVLHETRCNGTPQNQQLQQTQQSAVEREAASSLVTLPSPEPGHQLTPDRTSSFSRSRSSSPSDTRGATSSNSPNVAEAGSSIAPRATESADGGADANAATATFVGNIRPPAVESSSLHSYPTVAPDATSSDSGDIHLQEGQWQCPRCTLINNSTDARCDACLAPRNGGTGNANRPPDAGTNERLVQREENGWVNVTYNPQFQRTLGGRRVPIQQNRFGQPMQNPIVQGAPTNVGTAARVFNGLVNGAIVGSVFAGGLGMILGGLAGAAGGAIVDRARAREEQNQSQETREVANMLVNDDGGIEAGTVRVHRSNGFVTALARDSTGRNRVIRIRYGDGLRARRQRMERPGGRDAEVRQQAMEQRNDLERSLLEILVQMSYARDFGPGTGNNVILQPEETFEELIQRFGLGTENRGASQEVIDSYPVETVRKEAAEGNEDKKASTECLSEGKTPETNDERAGEEDSGLGTCGICLEDYRVGEQKKTLGCPTHPHCFHKDCIDKWLKLVASCPICKSEVGMYTKPAAVK